MAYRAAMYGVMAAKDELGEIYIGATVEEWSERRVIEHVHAALTAAGSPFVVLANFQIRGRQIDCVFITENRVMVVEVKASRLPVRGAIDGDWGRRQVSGEWRHYRNGYQQVVSQKNRLRDAMGAHRATGDFYPDAAVVFARPLPDGSALTQGDKKAEVTELVAFDADGQGDRGNPWSAKEWREFAASLSLRSASVAEIQGGAEAAPHFDLIREYRDHLTTKLGRDGERWLAEDKAQRADLLAGLDGAPGCYLEGPSGCGKTLASRWLGSHLSRSGECVLFLAAKDFDGSWARLLRRELSLVLESSVQQLFGAIRVTGTPVRIVLDGVNELGPSREAAFRGLRALARRLDARVIATGQSAQPEQLAGLQRIAISPPSVELKERIATARLPALGAGMRAVLKGVASGFEAAIVAEIGSDATADASRQLLVDQLIRKRLGADQRAGSTGLRRFAKTLIETISFSMNETVFDEAMLAHGLAGAEVDALFAAQILTRHGGRVSFAHEILLHACAAFAFAQIAAQAGEKLAILLSLPVLEPIATDVVSVIEDSQVVDIVLRSTSDSGLIHEAARGLAGPIAAAVADRLLSETEDDLEAEIAGLRLAIVSGERVSIGWEPGTVREWSDQEAARISALARDVGTGHRIKRYFVLCALMDAALYEERHRLFDAATAAGIRTLRSDAFSLAYYGIGQETGFTKISRLAMSGVFSIVDPVLQNPPRDMMSLTSGQLNFYLDRRRMFHDDSDLDAVAEALAKVVTERFRLEPYHVKLSILETAPFVGRASQDKVAALVEAIEAIDANRESLWISTAIIDALKFLDALEDSAEGAREGIEAEFVRAINADEDDLTLNLALSTSIAMFDHPYDWIYGDAFEALTPKDRRTLMRRAARSDGARQSASLTWIIQEVASFGDPADAATMQEFAKLPNPRNSFPQEEWGAFTVATRFLGRHHLSLPEQQAATDVELAMVELRALLHAVEGGAASAAIQAIWARLDQLPVNAVMGCFSEVEHALLEQDWSEQRDAPKPSILKAFVPRWLNVARRFLDGEDEGAHHHYAYDRERAPGLAFQIIELHGNRGDIARLKRLAGTPRHARRALEALRKLDAA
ncbi:Nuclease-related domain-containing protein [Sphingomonas carotinifaciens]|uniref:Nuclease-related domain-containing protein n=3 Tax=Sphingomonas carotinifaciens TaxID=1166323 RepID=A0A1G7NG40_9SPHN|nr:NERD domain-containing protein [Sphingomonas carotinifaciens]SDF73065.1 Nuclease-related domain-containing protein [Sphingomonas carotinifaciens]